MKVMHSACTAVLFPESRKNIDAFRRTAEFLAERGVGGIEFYYDGDSPDSVGDIVKSAGLDPIFIGVIPSKEKKLWLCDVDREGRAKAVALFKDLIAYSQDNGIATVMLNSGRIMPDIDAGLDALAASVAELYEYIASTRYATHLCLEPCDDAMDALHLVGPYRRALAFVRRVNDLGHPLTLTMDSAHTVETGEDFAEAVAAAKPYCNHVHFANCNVTQPDNPLYGDKHLGFEYPDSEWTPDTLEALYRRLEDIYPGDEPLRIGIEILCREEDPYAYYDKTRALLPFLR